jgi:hypothetical protein
MSRARDFADLAGSADAGGLTGRNLIINGAMQVFQRATAATTATTTYSTADRFVIYESTDGSMTTEKSSDHPFSGSSLKAQVTGADTSIAAGQFAYIYQNIEAQNLQHLLYGTSSAKPLTLSFYVKSSKTGVYTVNLDQQDNTGYIFVQEYTISSANTWEKKTITITPDSNIKASGGAIDNDTGTGLSLGFGLVWGSNTSGGTSETWSARSNGHYGTSNQVNWMDSTSNNFYLTEVQLEVGDKATPFEHRSFADELLRCQRYFQRISGGGDAFTMSGKCQGTTSVDVTLAMPTNLRASPTMNSITSRAFHDGGFNESTSTTPTALQFSAGNSLLAMNCGGYSGFTNNEIVNWGPVSNALTIDAEL